VKRSNRVFILLGIVLAVIAFVGVIVLTNKGGTESPAATPTATVEAKTPVVVAARDINMGETITADMVAIADVPVSTAAGYGADIFSSKDQVTNKIAASDIRKGDPLHDGADVLHILPGSVTQGQDISGSIDAGYLGVSMEIDQVSGVGTLIVPGDHVDVILSVYVDQIGLTTTTTNKTPITLVGGQQVTTKLIIQNCKVLATLLPPIEAAPTGAPGPAAATPTPSPAPSSQSVTNNGQHMIVMIQVKPDQAEVIRWAQRAEKDPQNYIGLSLALRSPKDNDKPPVTTLGVTFSELVTRYGVLPPDPRGVIPGTLASGLKW